MIQANELRIGNWVIDRGIMTPEIHTHVKVNRIENHYIDGLKINGLSGNDFYKPIPLTNEVLLKCGFEFKDMMFANSAMRYWRNDFIIWHPEKVVYIFNEKETEKEISILYLHQLQNLHFALYQTELNYTP